jgi:hypothetical protein
MDQYGRTLVCRMIRRGVHRSTRALEDAIRQFLDANNENPRPFVWTKSADEILASIARFCERTSNLRTLARISHED